MAQISYLWHITEQIELICNSLDGEKYATPLAILSKATIGKHTRHIIDGFATVVRGIEQAEISFDHRERNLQTENDRFFALNLLKSYANQIATCDFNKKVTLISDFSHGEERITIRTESTLGRELIYAIEHAIHHLAIIKIGIETSLGTPLPSDFGVAPSTIRFMQSSSN